VDSNNSTEQQRNFNHAERGRKIEFIFLPPFSCQNIPSRDQSTSFTFQIRQLAALGGRWRLKEGSWRGTDDASSLCRIAER
jgi:hypothetical protein